MDRVVRNTHGGVAAQCEIVVQALACVLWQPKACTTMPRFQNSPLPAEEGRYDGLGELQGQGAGVAAVVAEGGPGRVVGVLDDFWAKRRVELGYSETQVARGGSLHVVVRAECAGAPAEENGVAGG